MSICRITLLSRLIAVHFSSSAWPSDVYNSFDLTQGEIWFPLLISNWSLYMCLTSRTLQARRWYLFICSLAWPSPGLRLSVPFSETCKPNDVYYGSRSDAEMCITTGVFATREKKSDSLLYSWWLNTLPSTMQPDAVSSVTLRPLSLCVSWVKWVWYINPSWKACSYFPLHSCWEEDIFCNPK